MAKGYLVSMVRRLTMMSETVTALTLPLQTCPFSAPGPTFRTDAVLQAIEAPQDSVKQRLGFPSMTPSFHLRNVIKWWIEFAP